MAMLINVTACRRVILEQHNSTRYAKKSRVDALVLGALNEAVKMKMESIINKQNSKGKTIVL